MPANRTRFRHRYQPGQFAPITIEVDPNEVERIIKDDPKLKELYAKVDEINTSVETRDPVWGEARSRVGDIYNLVQQCEAEERKLRRQLANIRMTGLKALIRNRCEEIRRHAHQRAMDRAAMMLYRQRGKMVHAKLGLAPVPSPPLNLKLKSPKPPEEPGAGAPTQPGLTNETDKGPEDRPISGGLSDGERPASSPLDQSDHLGGG